MAIGPVASGAEYGGMLFDEEKKKREEAEKQLASTQTQLTEMQAKPPVPTLEGIQQSTQTTTTTEPGFKPSPGAVQEQEKAFAAQERAAEKVQQAQQASIEAEAAAREKMQVAKLQEAEKVQKQQEDYKKNLATEMGKYETAYKALADANKVEVNPRRYIDNMSTGSKVMVGLGLLLSGFGGSDSVTKSMSIFNKAVDDDIAAQKIAREGKIEAARTGISHIDKKVQSVRDNLKDDNAFYELQRDLRFGAIESQIDQAIAKTKVPESLAKLEQAKATIQQQRAESKMKLEEMARDKSKTVSVTGKEEKFVAGGAKKDMKAATDLRQEFKQDQVVKDSTEIYSMTRRAKDAMKLAKAGDAGAVGTVATLAASSIQKGALTEGDYARGSGVPTQIWKRGTDAVQKYILDMPPENQMKTLNAILNETERGARERYGERESAYRDLAVKYGTDPELVTVPLGGPAQKAAGGPAVGTVEGGYRFKGGDPSVQSNWEKVK